MDEPLAGDDNSNNKSPAIETGPKKAAGKLFRVVNARRAVHCARGKESQR